MKVQIVYLDPHDDQVSARDKLAWAQAPRVLLVWPPEGRLLRRQLDLVLLRRQAARQGAQLGLVTHDPEVVDHAAVLGIPVFASTDDLAESGWRRGRSKAEPRRPPRPGILADPRPAQTPGATRWLRWPMFVLACIALLVLIGLTLPAARIVVSPVTRPQEIKATLRLDPEIKAPQADGRIPSRQATVTVSGDLRVPATGSVMVPAKQAAGAVQFTNLTASPVNVPAGSGVLPQGHPELRFQTTEGVLLEGSIGATAAVGVIAQNAGSVGNLPAGALNAMDGPLGLQASVTNPAPTAGGTDASRAAASAGDRARLLQLLSESLVQSAATQLSAQMAAGEKLAARSLRIVRIIDESYDHPAGEAADTVSLTMRIEVAGLAYRPKDALQAGKLALQAALPAGSLGVPGSQSIELLSDSPDNVAADLLPFRATQQAFVPFDLAAVRRMVRGRSPSEASQLLRRSLSLAAPPSVVLTPAWWPWIPWLDVRIEVSMPWEAR